SSTPRAPSTPRRNARAKTAKGAVNEPRMVRIPGHRRSPDHRVAGVDRPPRPPGEAPLPQWLWGRRPSLRLAHVLVRVAGVRRQLPRLHVWCGLVDRREVTTREGITP